MKYLRDFMDSCIPIRDGFWSVLVPWRALFRWFFFWIIKRLGDSDFERVADLAANFEDTE